MDRITVYDVEERVPVNGDEIWVLNRRVNSSWNPRIPENIKKGRVVYMHTHDSIKYHKDYYEIENGETYFSVKGDFKNYLLQSELEVFVTGNVDK